MHHQGIVPDCAVGLHPVNRRATIRNPLVLVRASPSGPSSHNTRPALNLISFHYRSSLILQGTVGKIAPYPPIFHAALHARWKLEWKGHVIMCSILDSSAAR